MRTFDGKNVRLCSVFYATGGKILAGSCVGGIRDTQEMLDFAAKHNITAEVEVVGINDVNTAMERLARGEVRYRFVVDVANTI